MSTRYRTTLPDPAMIEPAILAKLHDVTRTTNGWSARCPAHEDERPSLSIGAGDDGRVLVHCFAGCTPEQVVGAVGMQMADLGPAMNIVAAYDYRDEHGTVLFQAVRLSPKSFRLRRLNAKGDWVWKMDGVRRVPYRLPELQGQHLALLVEGEKDADNVATLGLPATTTPMGAGAWRDEYAAIIKASGVEEVVVIPDNDAPGRRYAVQAGAALIACGIAVRVLELLGVPEKGDVSNWLEAGGTADELKALAEQAPTFDVWQGTDAVMPVVDIRDGDYRRIVEESFSAIVQTNRRRGGPKIFVGPDNLVRVIRRLSDRPSMIEVLTDDILRGYLIRHVVFLAGKEDSSKSVPPPPIVVRDILTRPTWTGLPELRGVIETPVLSRDGEVVTTPGYQPQTLLWYSPAPDLELPAIPERPTASDVTAAAELLAEVVCDFPFDSPGSRANALALMLVPFVREFIKGPTPLHVIDATTPGTGKGLLADCCSVVATGRDAGKGPEPRDPDETRKFITSVLVAGASMVVLDNIVGHLDSAPLARVLTAEIWEDRLLGYSRQVRPLNRAVWVATGNNMTLSRELARRAVWIRLEPEQERPELRDDFRHPDLLRWVREQRGPLIAACLILARAWVVNGRPRGSEVLERMFGSYESWLDVMGGVLAVAGIEGLLENRDKLTEQGDDELTPWRFFFHLWREAVEADLVPREAHAHELLDLAGKAGLDVGDMGFQSQLRRLGQALSKIEGRVIGSARLKSRVLNGRKLYRIG